MDLNNRLIYSKSTSGKALQWRAYTDYSTDSDGYMTITIEFGQVDGKLQLKTRCVKSGKNFGKTNATTLREQTDLEIGYLYQKQLDKDYVLDLESYSIPLSPQLAHKYKDKSHKVVWSDEPSVAQYASTKLNGIRCAIFVKNGKVTKFESRTRKLFKYFNHIAKDLINFSCEDEIEGSYAMLDGELFNHSIPFEILCSLINSDEYVEVIDDKTGISWSTNDVQFHCYDIVNLNKKDQTFYERFINFNGIPITESIRLVESLLISNEEDMVTLATQWIQLGYEGLMLRYGGAQYAFGQRSQYLLKYKIMEQGEFRIKRIYLAENDSTKVMFNLYNHLTSEKEYSEFDCALKGDKKINLLLYENKQLHEEVDWLTVDYQVLSKYSVPLFPVGIVVRKGEVKDGEFIPSV